MNRSAIVFLAATLTLSSTGCGRAGYAALRTGIQVVAVAAVVGAVSESSERRWEARERRRAYDAELAEARYQADIAQYDADRARYDAKAARAREAAEQAAPAPAPTVIVITSAAPAKAAVDACPAPDEGWFEAD